MREFLARLAADRFLPAVVLGDVHQAHPLADALAGGGLGTMEITLRTDGAVRAIAELAGRPDILVGAGTVVRAEQVDEVVEAGARFVVTPGWSAQVVDRCAQHGIPVLPGAATPGEVMAALEAGIDTIKLFPAAQLGGPDFVAALAGPFPGLRVVPSGGITPEVAGAYLRLPSVLAVSGSWVTSPELLAAGDFDGVRQAARRRALAARSSS
jgi:2-dehydro-3-deoxyphosphogluconate aldolase/(4S)-4-hydroxy-2-oxoglutarate aldolase